MRPILMIHNTAEKLAIRQWHVSRKMQNKLYKIFSSFLKTRHFTAENLCEMFSVICYTAAETNRCSCRLRKKKYLNI